MSPIAGPRRRRRLQRESTMRVAPRLGRWPLLAAIIALMFCLLPAPVLGQGIKDALDDDPATEEATEEPFDPAEQAEAWEAAGLIDDRSYESPQFGYTLGWSRDWALDVYYDLPEEDLQPVMSNEDIEQDIIYLVWSGGSGEEAYAIVSGQTVNRGGPEGDVETWLEPDFIDDTWDPALEVEPLLDDSTRDAGAVLYSVADPENPDSLVYYTLYQSIELEDGTTLYLTFSAGEDVIEDAYASWASDLDIDGAPIDLVFEWEDIDAAM